MSYDTEQRTKLIALAEASIRHAVQTGEEPTVEPDALGKWATEPRATFVTLHVDGRLQGCIGTMEAIRPLATDICSNAWRAALRDPRFPPLTHVQLDEMSVHLAVLGPLAAMDIDGEASLLSQLRVGIDGLLIQNGRHRATFLPAVWKKVESPEQFLMFLKRKAGLPLDIWPDDMRAYRYEVEEFDRETPD